MNAGELKTLARKTVEATREALAYRAMMEAAISLQNQCGDPDFCTFQVYESACNVRDEMTTLYDRATRRSQLTMIDFAYAYNAAYKARIPTLMCYRQARMIAGAER